MQSIFLKIDKILLLLVVFFSLSAYGLERKTSHQISWQTHDNYLFKGKYYSKFTTFPTAIFPKINLMGMPEYHTSIKISGNRILSVSLITIQTRTLSAAQFQLSEAETKDLKDFTITYEITYNRGETEILVKVVPVRKSSIGSGFDLLEKFDLDIEYEATSGSQQFGKKPVFATSSVLASGDWIRLGVVNTGVHQLTRGYLQSIGIDMDNINPKTIKIYGMGAGMLPQKNSENRFDDLFELSIQVNGESDGVFNEGDAVLFFGQSQQDVWRFNATNSRFVRENNIYADTTYYFLTYGGANGKRIATQPTAAPSTRTSSGMDVLYAYENDRVNLIKSGRLWLGEDFDKTTQRNFTVNLPPLVNGATAIFTSAVVARSFTPSSFTVSVNGTNYVTHSIPNVPSRYDAEFASDLDGLKTVSFPVGSGNLNIAYTYNQSSPGSVGWLNYFQIQTRGLLQLIGNQLVFTDAQSIAPAAVTQFDIMGAAGAGVWDITNSLQPSALQTNFTANNLIFRAATDSLRKFVVFKNTGFFGPVSANRVANQNLHALTPADLLIITHPEFLNEAFKLAEFHRGRGLTTHVVNVFEIYNEFSSGSQDISAIRDFIRMIYYKGFSTQDMLKYVTLFGRASYDYKYRLANNTNYVPTFASLNSFDPVLTYNTDDFFGLMDDNEGKWETDEDNNAEKLDVAIGRLPAQNNAQAQAMVNKIIQYASKNGAGDWSSRLVFVADDEDGGIHTFQANGLANTAIQRFNHYNVRKIFIDAYKEELGTGGQRNPAAQDEIVRSVERGALIINYTGHGGEVGWAEERILNTDDINRWRNGFKLPAFFTATCEFSRFDDPARTSAGEMVLLNPDGGGIALFTTVRLVNSGDNLALNNYFYDFVGLDSASLQSPKTMGEIMRLTKNAYLSINTRNFALLGDPAITFSLPNHYVKTSSINKLPVNSLNPDTISAYEKVEVGGIITDKTGKLLSEMNGVIYPTVFDKPTIYRTLGNNATSPVINFNMQNNVIFRGQASVKNGVFNFSFVVPKDIAYEVGKGKMSYYALGSGAHAIGGFTDFFVGGTADSFAIDKVGPEMKLYLNDEKFVFGGITDENPFLIVKINDESGINITGKGIGRDISLVLNEKTDNVVSLNEYYQTNMDDYKSGEVRYQLKGLQQGTNKLVVKAWDSYNNSTESMLEFVVASSEKMAIKNMLNYPNPFTTQTTFHFDHNKAGQALTVLLQVFTVSGKLVKTLSADVINPGNHFDNLVWDGKDDYGDLIGKGVYVYKVKVRTSNGEAAEAIQKLVILN